VGGWVAGRKSETEVRRVGGKGGGRVGGRKGGRKEEREEGRQGAREAGREDRKEDGRRDGGMKGWREGRKEREMGGGKDLGSLLLNFLNVFDLQFCVCCYVQLSHAWVYGV